MNRHVTAGLLKLIFSHVHKRDKEVAFREEIERFKCPAGERERKKERKEERREKRKGGDKERGKIGRIRV